MTVNFLIRASVLLELVIIVSEEDSTLKSSQEILGKSLFNIHLENRASLSCHEEGTKNKQCGVCEFHHF